MATERVLRQIDRLLGEAEAAIGEANWPLVRQKAEAALRLSPGNEDALAYLQAANTDPGPGHASPVPGAERRLMAVMFCDLASSTAMSEELDPEDLRDVLREYQHAAAAIVDRLGGYTAHYMGDGLLVYFGFPTAHEDDADRAVRAALEIVDGVGSIRAPGGGHPLAARAGLHYGLAVVAEMGSGERIQPNDVVGETANIAARLQSLAPPGGVVASADLLRLTKAGYALEPLGPQALRGLSRPIEVSRVAGLAPRDWQTAEKGAPFLGRTRELAMVSRAWSEAVAGSGSGLLVRAEAGLGKTRLVREFQRRLDATDHTFIGVQGSAFHTNTAFYPVVRSVAGALLDLDAPRGAAPLDRLGLAYEGLGLAPAEGIPPLAMLLGLSLEGRYPELTGPPGEIRERIFAALLAWIVGLCNRRPVLIAVEDVHWLDPSSLDLVARVLPVARGKPLLLLLTTRTEFAVPEPVAASCLTFTLGRLDAADTEQLVAGLVAGTGVAPEEIRRLAARAEGVPLFAEELSRLAAEAGAAGEGSAPLPAARSTIPPALYGSLMARLDRAPANRRLAQLCSVVGREISVALVSGLAGNSEEQTLSDLDRLVEAGVLAPRGRNGHYAFKHALIQDVAYESLLRPDRAGFHAAVARQLEERFPSLRDAEPETVAYHLARAGDPGRAIPYLRRAATLASARFANTEAMNYLTQALELAHQGGAPPAVETELRLALGQPLTAVRGYASPEVEANYRLAMEAARTLSDPVQTFHALRGLGRFYQVQGGLDRARPIAKELVERAERIGSPFLMASAHLPLGEQLALGGYPEQALVELKRATGLFEEALGTADGAAAEEPYVSALAYSGFTAWFLGYPDRARAEIQRAIDRSRERNLPSGLVYSLVLAAWVHQLRDQPGPAGELAREAKAIAQERKFGYWLYASSCLVEWASARTGDADAVARVQAAVATYFAAGNRTAGAWLHSLVADAMLAHCDTAGARDAVAHGLETATATGEEAFEPLLWEIRGSILSTGAGGDADSRRDFRLAVTRARERGAKSLELRAAMRFAAAFSPEGTAALELALAKFPEQTADETRRARAILNSQPAIKEHTVDH